ncbi:MAG TPA: adenylate/guanylate cyclase domain-containing protein [Candidatus Acidoferrales bacterium]|nr:adenylate/guanylate cyclase domain-containing protein [Candidatus Acidoferrales bacterium]
MQRMRTVILAALTALGVFLACEIGLALGSFDFLENRSFDLRVQWAPPRQPPPAEIVIIDIDNPSFAALRDAIGRWPWTRLLWAELVKYLHAGGARLIVFDVVFAGRESDQVDGEFAQAIAAAGNVVLSAAFVQYEAGQAAGQAESLPAELPGAIPLSDQVGLTNLSPERFKLDPPLASLADAARGLGSITAIPDPDGTIRRVALVYRWNDRYYPSLALASVAQARDLSGQAPVQLTRREFRWGSLRVPVTRQGLLVPHWRPQPTAFPRLPLWKVTCSVFPEVCPPGQRHFKAEDFQDKIVIIGASALGAFDFFATPVAPVTPGFLVHATALDSLLRQRAIAEPEPYVPHLLVILFVGLSVAIVWGFRSAAIGSLAAVAVAALYTSVSVWAFARWEVWLPLAAPLLTLAVGFTGQSLTRYVTTGRELRKTRQTLSRYMSPRVVDHILAHGGPDQLRGQRQVITVMFSDVRNFTKMSERRPPAEVMDILNRYLDAMTEIVFEHDGVVDKFIGDGMLCYWGAFGDADRHARLAVSAASRMLAKLEDLNQNWRTQGMPELSIGIGINTGEAVFGNLGAGKKIEFTVLGDTVNVASRLESMNKEYGTSVILSESTQTALGTDLPVRLLGEVTIRGREQKTKVYTLP